MRTQSIDTHPEVERVLIEMIRNALMFKWFRSVTRQGKGTSCSIDTH